ncbi:hypothetical protein [Polaribacter sargassicola]|uniref:hypothetical protein n=1 Tax=Polaribacter sargassicola TaxID=2836891 RepID=UPI001F47CBAF|nr:hypothetical protein [Polaribacter sp. DS7-9]MCG1037074.1 hypothetical protein [Polaribacter sp. DS7-9]
MQKIFNIVIITFSIILSLFSLLAFLIVHLELIERNFQFDLEGINNYFAEITKFKELFAGTITLILGFYGLKRLKTAEKSHKEKIKNDRFSDWKSITDLRINEIGAENKIFVREFSRMRYNLFEDIYANKMSILNKKELNLIFDKHFNHITKVFEENNKEYKGMQGIYKTEQSTYFFKDFYFVFIGSLDNYYDEIDTDLKERYLATLNIERKIGVDLYNRAYKAYTGLV